MTIESSVKNYLTVKQFAAKFPWPSESALRAIIQNASERGFDTAIKRFYRRVLIDPQEFFACLDRIQGSSSSGSNKAGGKL